MIVFAALFFIWVVFIPIAIMLISNNSTRIGFYHASKLSKHLPFFKDITSMSKSDDNDDDDELELFFDKYIEVATCNCRLSAPFIFSFYSILISSNLCGPIDIEKVILLSFTFTIIILILMRFLSHPTEKFCKPVLFKFITIPDESKKERLMKSIVKDHNERILAFFFSFFSAAILVSLILISYDILVFYSINASGESSELVNTTSIISPLIGTGDVSNIITLFLNTVTIYITILFILTFISEIILFLLKPIRQFVIVKGEWKRMEKNGKEWKK